MFTWLKKRRRCKLFSRPWPCQWTQYLDRNVWHYARLTDDQREQLHRCVRVFVAEKEWVGCGGLEITDEVQVTIAGIAGLLLLGIDAPYYFDGVRSILVYPGAYVHPPEWQGTGHVVFEEVVEGESWHRGPIVLSWQHVLDDAARPADGHNVVLHEFAHHLDNLDGYADGVPPLGSRREYEHWRDVTDEEFERLVRGSRRGKATLLDQYGASDRAEFFAVATEIFFERPADMKRVHPELYAILQKFYRQDPAEWFEAAPVASRQCKRKRSSG